MTLRIIKGRHHLCYYIPAHGRPELMEADKAEKRLEREVAAINRLRERGKEWGGKYPRIDNNPLL